MTFFTSQLKRYDGLIYLRTEEDRHFFKLPIEHPGHLEFKGCSGAPILNSAGMPVALVCGGDTERNEIYGVSLSHYRSVVDILVGNFD